MNELLTDHYWKTPFYWEAGCPTPPLQTGLTFQCGSDDRLRPLIARAMETSLDPSDQFNVPRVGIEAAVQEVFDLLPQYFDPQQDGWRVGQDQNGQPFGFVLPVTFKEARFWKDGRPQGTILYMGVLPAHRGKGYGLALVHEATRCLLEAGCWRIFCDTGAENAPMISAFRRAGYIERKNWQRPLAS